MAYPNNNYNYAKRQEAPLLSTSDKDSIRKIIQADGDAGELVKFANEKAEVLAQSDGLSTSQLRNIFGEFRKIEAFWDKDKAASRRRLQLLLPKLAYQQKREKKTERFCAVMTEAINCIFNSGTDIDKGFKNCMDLMEAIVAYHKFYGGKD